ncbi:urease subunit beta [Vibrio alfacsensis]|uniref:Urease subunit beta n=1 Tax=Vibrio alfacsensis TaxID=1074311 RepID=A0ABM6YZ86_9VIBR|nr:urease subunit beta [Vibrio alfacsensis]
MIPGEIKVNHDLGDIILNGRTSNKTLRVSNLGDRPIQVGSHYHFYEVNTFLDFDREEALGYRLNIPAGMAVRFEPGQEEQLSWLSLAANVKFWFSRRRDGKTTG